MRKALIALLGIGVLAGMTGCRHPKPVVSVPPPPAPKPVKVQPVIPRATLADMPYIPMPAPPSVVLGGAVAPSPSRHEEARPNTSEQASTDTAEKDAKSSATAGEEPPPGTPIGQLSAAANTQGLPSSKTIHTEIQWIQGQLKGIHHALNAKQQSTESQIQTFLAKATNALQAGDLDGAHTLTVKARVLLAEIQ